MEDPGVPGVPVVDAADAEVPVVAVEVDAGPEPDS